MIWAMSGVDSMSVPDSIDSGKNGQFLFRLVNEVSWSVNCICSPFAIAIERSMCCFGPWISLFFSLDQKRNWCCVKKTFFAEKTPMKNTCTQGNSFCFRRKLFSKRTEWRDSSYMHLREDSCLLGTYIILLYMVRGSVLGTPNNRCLGLSFVLSYHNAQQLHHGSSFMSLRWSMDM